MVNDNNSVDDGEILYRRLPPGSGLYQIANDGTVKISSQAFSSRDYRISVDRAKLCGNNPRHTLDKRGGGVVSLVAGEIRNIVGIARKGSNGDIIQQFKIDVETCSSTREFCSCGNIRNSRV